MRTIPLLRRLDDNAKLRLKEAMPSAITRRLRPNMIRRLRHPVQRCHPAGTPLWAMLCTWHEVDIVRATVANALSIGAQRVYLIDNGSDDGTVDAAIEAGATHVLTFHTEKFDELHKYRLINETIRHLSQESGLDRVWWMMMDADEFLATPDGRPFPQWLAETDEACRVVGARVLDHYPDPGVQCPPDVNPLAYQTMCREKTDHRCLASHHKHPIFLWGRELPAVSVDPGFHQLSCPGGLLYEAPWSAVLHHFPFRSHAASLHRLRLLADRGATQQTVQAAANTHMAARLASIDAVYAGRYEDVIDYRTGRPGITVHPWTGVVADQPATTSARRRQTS